MRLIQQKPAWSLHAYLRFNDLRYVSEFTPSFSALGRSLPIIVTGKAVISEEESFSLLAEQLRLTTENDKVNSDGIVAKFIHSAVVGCFNQIVHYNGDSRHAVVASSPIGINLVFGSVLDIQDALNKDKFDFIPGASQEELLTHLKIQYKQLDAALLDHENENLASLIAVTKRSFIEAQKSAPSVGALKRGAADAVLFGHLAEALCNETISPIVKKYPSLIKFFESVCSTYFAAPFAASGSDGSSNWTVALNGILDSSYMGHARCNHVKSLLTTPKKGGLEIQFQSAGPARACASVLFLNEAVSIDDREVTVHEEGTRATSISLGQELFPVKAVVEGSTQVLNNIKSTVGIKSEGAAQTPPIKTNSTHVTVSLGGAIYMGAIVACFVGYLQLAK